MAKVLNMSDLLKDEVELVQNYRKANESAKKSIAEYAAQSAEGFGPRTPIENLTKSIPDDGLIHLHDLSFDFDGYFARDLDNMSESEREEYTARIYGMFCRDVFTSGGDMRRVSFWAANYVAERLYQALGGVAWEDIMGLPWDEPTPYFSRIGLRAYAIYAGVQTSLKDDPRKKVTALIAEQADKHNISPALATKDYYAFKNVMDKVADMPTNFINQPTEN